MTTFGRLLAEARGDRLQTDLAAKLGVAQATVSSWESDSNFPRRRRLRGIAKAYGVEFDRLLRLWLSADSEKAA